MIGIACRVCGDDVALPECASCEGVGDDCSSCDGSGIDPQGCEPLAREDIMCSDCWHSDRSSATADWVGM